MFFSDIHVTLLSRIFVGIVLISLSPSDYPPILQDQDYGVSVAFTTEGNIFSQS